MRRPRAWRGGRGRLAGLGLAWLFWGAGPAAADPWIPSAGSGVAKPMVRYYRATDEFPADRFTSDTVPSSTETKTQYRVTGTHGIGHGLSIEYDLRAARADKVSERHGQRIENSASGLEDQEIGINWGLRQRDAFADSLTLNAIVPAGSHTSTPALGTGRPAIEPDYQVGVAGASTRAELMLGPRVFLDGGAVQMRVTGWLGMSLTPRLRLAGTLFYVRTDERRSPLPAGDLNERYNLLRLGAEVGYKLTPRVKPYLAYEDYVAGKARHAGARYTLGVALRY